MKLDTYGALMINRGHPILIAFSLYYGSNNKHKLSTILVATVANLARLVTLKLLIQNITQVFCVYLISITCITYD